MRVLPRASSPESPRIASAIDDAIRPVVADALECFRVGEDTQGAVPSRTASFAARPTSASPVPQSDQRFIHLLTISWKRVQSTTHAGDERVPSIHCSLSATCRLEKWVCWG